MVEGKEDSLVEKDNTLSQSPYHGKIKTLFFELFFFLLVSLMLFYKQASCSESEPISRRPVLAPEPHALP